jgi:hypothetical protein
MPGTGQERFQIASHAEQGSDQSVSQTSRDAPGLSHVAIVNCADSSVEIDVDAPSRSILVLHDLSSRLGGRVDGRKELVLHANILFRGVEVPVGHHRVVFSPAIVDQSRGGGVKRFPSPGGVRLAATSAGKTGFRPDWTRLRRLWDFACSIGGVRAVPGGLACRGAIADSRKSRRSFSALASFP